MYLSIKSIQSCMFRNIFEMLKDLILDTVLMFDANGMSITALDATRHVLVHVKLLREKFEEFSIDVPKVVAGIHVPIVYRILRTVTASDSLHLEMTDVMSLRITVDNTTRHCSTLYTVKLLDMDEENIAIPEFSYHNVHHLNASHFAKLIKEMSCIATHIDVGYSSDFMAFRCTGDLASQTTYMYRHQEGSSARPGDDAVTFHKGFRLKPIISFSKASSMCQQVAILVQDEFPLIIKFDFDSLGSMWMLIA